MNTAKQTKAGLNGMLGYWSQSLRDYGNLYKARLVVRWIGCGGTGLVNHLDRSFSGLLSILQSFVRMCHEFSGWQTSEMYQTRNAFLGVPKYRIRTLGPHTTDRVGHLSEAPIAPKITYPSREEDSVVTIDEIAMIYKNKALTAEDVIDLEYSRCNLLLLNDNCRFLMDQGYRRRFNHCPYIDEHVTERKERVSIMLNAKFRVSCKQRNN